MSYGIICLLPVAVMLAAAIITKKCIFINDMQQKYQNSLTFSENHGIYYLYSI